MPFGSGLSAPLAGSGSRTLTTGVHLRSAIHPLLGRLRIGAPRLWPLSPKLHTSDCSFACPGSSTWVDKVPSRDTPSLNLADRRGGVDPGNPQVARNRIEHRLFAYISQNWRGKPLVSHQVIVQLIGATTTQTGLTVRCEIDANRYPKGIKVTAAEMAALAIERGPFHGEWTYTTSPIQQPP